MEGTSNVANSGTRDSSKARLTKIGTTLEEVDRDLKEEEETLLRMKELVMKEISVLKAEEVTIQRLLAAHTDPSPKQSNKRPVPADPTGPSSSLPHINLDVGSSKHTKNGKYEEACGDGEEEYDSDDYDDEQGEEEMDEG